ncbi:MFS transporter [Paenibacillus nasutitermitis]|uniref:MFS transporter n=1 Tax=Paenibacillus nasutitermitis TaxID=1652958 RepID=A0A917E0T5_9BACL|nr:MFS transporter [Paenibacillus nasutitermitis]GGD86630.1 MFS transporter [Paenibacillus nasutitermitis]
MLGNKSAGILAVMGLFIAALNLRPAINSIAPILESIRLDLGMNASAASLLTAIPVLCMGVFSPLAAKLGTRWGIEKTIMWSLVLIGAGLVLRWFTDSPFFLILTAVLAGIGIASIGPLLSGFIKRYFPSNVPSMIAVYTMALTIGAALASVLSVPLQTKTDSWQIGLAAWGALAILALPVWLRIVGKYGVHHTRSTSSSQMTRLPWKNKNAWLLTLHFGLMAMGFYSITAWLPPIMQSMGYSKLYAGTLLTIFAVVQIPAGLVLKTLLKRFPSRLIWLLAASTLEFIGLILVLLNLLPWLAAALIGFGAGMLFALSLLLPIDATSNAEDAASWAAMTQSGGYIIGSAGPILIGWVNDATQSFSLAVIGLIVITVIMSVLQVIIVPKKAWKNKELAAVKIQ